MIRSPDVGAMPFSSASQSHGINNVGIWPGTDGNAIFGAAKEAGLDVAWDPKADLRPGEMGILQSHRDLLKAAWFKGLERLLILEDDALPHCNLAKELRAALEEELCGGLTLGDPAAQQQVRATACAATCALHLHRHSVAACYCSFAAAVEYADEGEEEDVMKMRTVMAMSIIVTVTMMMMMRRRRRNQWKWMMIMMMMMMTRRRMMMMMMTMTTTKMMMMVTMLMVMILGGGGVAVPSSSGLNLLWPGWLISTWLLTLCLYAVSRVQNNTSHPPGVLMLGATENSKVRGMMQRVPFTYKGKSKQKEKGSSRGNTVAFFHQLGHPPLLH